MATTKNTTSVKRTPKTTVKAPVAQDEQVVQPVEPAKKAEPIVVRQLDPNMFVSVRNGFNGMLVYRSPRTHEVFVWNEFGNEQDMELSELKNAKNTAKVFFENNWFLIDDPEVLEYLGVARYYRNALTYDNFDELFEMSPDEITARIKLLSDGQKASVRYRARQLIEEGVIDSLKVIDAIEKSLGVELIER